MTSNPYETTIEATETPRAREYRLLARATQMLAETKETQDIGSLYRAVLFNSEVWNTFLVDLTDERNALPLELKGSLISIGIFVGKFSGKVCDGEESVDHLIDINRSIMEGLKGEG